MVITGLTRNQFVSNHTRVRIPPSAPKEKGHISCPFSFGAEGIRRACKNSSGNCFMGSPKMRNEFLGYINRHRGADVRRKRCRAPYAAVKSAENPDRYALKTEKATDTAYPTTLQSSRFARIQLPLHRGAEGVHIKTFVLYELAKQNQPDWVGFAFMFGYYRLILDVVSGFKVFEVNVGQEAIAIRIFKLKHGISRPHNRKVSIRKFQSTSANFKAGFTFRIAQL